MRAMNMLGQRCTPCDDGPSLASSNPVMRTRIETLENVVAAGLRALPDWRGKASVALRWKRWRERREPLDGRWRVRLSDGSTVCLPRGSEMAWSVAATGYWDRHVIDLLAKCIAPRTIALDIGASLGLWSLPLAATARVVDAQLWCFEPNPDNAAWLQANIAANDLSSVAEVHQSALGAHSGIARLGCREHGGGNAALIEADDTDTDAVEVPVARLDDIEFPRRVSFMKMDVEGFELDVLRGARGLVERDRPAIFGEFNAGWLRIRREDLGTELLVLAGLGYDVFAVEERRSEWWRPRDVVRLRRIAPPQVSGCENLLLLPPGAPRPTPASPDRPRGIARRFPDRERRCGRSVPLVAWRYGVSLLRRRSRRETLSVPAIEVTGVRVRADLRTPLGLSLYRYGFCPPEARLLTKLLRPGDVFVDGGANIGLFSLIGALAVGPGGRVLACEPSPATMTLLRANAAENRFTTLEPHELALSDREGRSRFTVFEPTSGLASFSPKERGGREVEVAVTTLDVLTGDIAGSVAVVKLDIEGAEAKALRGAARLIARDMPVFIIELEPEHLARQGSSVADVRETLEPHGYEAYAITQHAMLTKLTGDWRPPDALQPNVVLAPRSRASQLAPLTAAAAHGSG